MVKPLLFKGLILVTSRIQKCDSATSVIFVNENENEKNDENENETKTKK